MNYGEVKELLDKGFTADEIRGFMTPNSEQKQEEQKQEEQKQEEQKQEEQKQEEQKENNSQNPQGFQQVIDEKFNKLSETVEKLTKLIQGNNRLKDSFDKPGENDINKQVDNIMASIIRPPHEKGE